MLRLKKKIKIDPGITPNYDTPATGDHLADKIVVLGCLLLLVVTIGVVLFLILS